MSDQEREYLERLCWAYLCSPEESVEEINLGEALQAACSRIGVEMDTVEGWMATAPPVEPLSFELDYEPTA